MEYDLTVFVYLYYDLILTEIWIVIKNLSGTNIEIYSKTYSLYQACYAISFYQSTGLATVFFMLEIYHYANTKMPALFFFNSYYSIIKR